jgi:hypothetical protein
VVALAASQIGPDLDAARGAYCNPYGPCEEWCALFATWAWNGAGFAIPRYSFTGAIYRWGAAHGRVVAPGGPVQPGDAVLYGTGPQNAFTSVHMGLVAQVWPNGAIDTIDGDSGPEPDGHYAVTVSPPFLPADSAQANAMPIYAFVRP